MAKYVNDIILDLGLNYIKTLTTRFNACIGVPANYTEAVTNFPTGKKCSSATVNSSNFTGPIDATSGRKLTTSAISGITVDVSGTADHIALVDTVNLTLLAIVSLSASVVVIAGNSMTINPFDINIQDPI